MEPADEQALLQKAQQGDHAAFGDLVHAHQTAVFNTTYRLLGRRRDAEDAAQEAFLRAYKALDRFDVKRPFAPWIKRIAVNVCYNWLQSARVRPQILAADIGNNEPADMDSWAAQTPSPEQELVASERERNVRHAILQLPPRYRVVIELRHFQGMAYQEIADVLQRPLSDIKSDLFRARKKLAQALKVVEV